MKNEYGANLDKNGYAPSIIPFVEGCCWCGRDGDLVRHEIFGGTGRREKSKRLGLWVHLCPACHEAVHRGKSSFLPLLQLGEMNARSTYGWSKEKFIREFGKSYLED